mmetsp:Transcript_32024/g.68208  ORF Transcript_32024/g.68208 Transcript_32024/m.68208 type:complete len:398 (+) Transcript_32024:711-1904(+)
MCTECAKRDGLVQHQQGAVLFLQLYQLPQRGEATRALADSLRHQEGAPLLCNPLRLASLLRRRRCLLLARESGLDGGHVAMRHPGDLCAAKPQPSLDAKEDLGVDDDMISILHQRRHNAGGRSDPRRVGDGRLCGQELDQGRFEVQVRPCCAVEAAWTACTKAVGMHRRLNGLLRSRQGPSRIAEGVEDTEVEAGARRLGPRHRHGLQRRRRQAACGWRRRCQSLGLPLLCHLGCHGHAPHFQRRRADPGVVLSTTRFLCGGLPLIRSFLVEGSDFRPNLGDIHDDLLQLLARVRCREAEPDPLVEHRHSGVAHDNDRDPTIEAHARELAQFVRMVEHHGHDGRVHVAKHLEALLLQAAPEEVRVFPDCSQLLLPHGTALGARDDPQRLQGLGCAGR